MKRLHEIENRLFLLEMADRMDENERNEYNALLRERNALMERNHHTKTEKEEITIIKVKTKEEEEEKEKKEKLEAEKRLALKLWEIFKNTNWVGLPVVEKRMKENGWG